MQTAAAGCPSCQQPVDPGSRFCGHCGTPLPAAAAAVAAVAADVPTSLAPSADPPPTPMHPSLRDRLDAQARFLPGMLLAGRYRLVALLGRGGMGEVYRAEDTRLGQTVALKFLPASLAGDPDMLARFFAEVRIGRQVSHPNVCRLHDLVEIEGQHCLSMEYVDGEDLSALLARIGRLPADKAIEIARDLCAGLAAAHEKGVIHRDLKPANIMIDGRGRARIADFGIAALADSIERESVAGTPAYMAPELLDGQPASVQSDLYALGLVLYELCTGKRLLQARSLDELRELHRTNEPPSVSDSVRDIPAAMARSIQDCLRREPQDRPASAQSVLASLPGGDPLQAAIAAGETPSPAMVAAANKVGALSPGPAFVLLLSGAMVFVAICALAMRTSLISLVDPPKSPEILTERAENLLRELGYPGEARDRHAAFTSDSALLRDLDQRQLSLSAWHELRQARQGPIYFLYRQSPLPLLAAETTMRPFGPAETGRITVNDPPPLTLGMVDVALDLQGRLLSLRALLATQADSGTAPVDWPAFFRLAEIDPADLIPDRVRGAIPVDADTRAAWRFRTPIDGHHDMRIEAAALDGRLVWFSLYSESLGPGVHFIETRNIESELPKPQSVAISTVLIASVGLWIAIALLCRRNLTSGRADRQGAWRLTLTIAIASLIGLMLRADHVSSPLPEATLLTSIAGQVFLYALINWLLYIALEPIARRRWPELLVSWNRLLAGRWRDALVGRDVLFGVIAGLCLALCLHLAVLMPEGLTDNREPPRFQVVTSLGAMRHFIHFVFTSANTAVVIGFGALLGYLVNRALVRKPFLALLLSFVSLYFGLASITSLTQLWSLAAFGFTALFVFALFRIGLLTAILAVYIYLLLEAAPLTLNLNAWYADRTIACAILVGALLGYGYWYSLGGRSPVGRLLDQDG